jgi:hypothetical protein
MNLERYYIIYHWPGHKCGCAKDLVERLRRQGLTLDDIEIIDLVSTSFGERFAGKVERAWNRFFGYVNGWDYSTSANNAWAGQSGGKKGGRVNTSAQQKARREAIKIAQASQTPEILAEAGRKGGRKGGRMNTLAQQRARSQVGLKYGSMNIKHARTAISHEDMVERGRKLGLRNGRGKAQK